uniref:Integrase core domain containing protein n=1 Tax=Solanum tuberosum TaxID=4113 RepID=M1DG99_SOLTU
MASMRNGSPLYGWASERATLNFVAKFFWLLVRNRVSPTKADNQVTWDRAVMVAAMVAGVEINFARMLLAEIQERAFKTSTTYPFPCLIFNCAGTRECRSGIVIVLPDHTDTVPASSSKPASRAPSSSQSTPQLGDTVFPLARVQKLEAQMATLLHHIQTWMQKSIAESEARMEQRMDGMMDRKAELASLRTDVDAILAAPSVELQVAPTALADDTVLDALFSGTAEERLAPTHAKGKWHRSHHTEEEKAQKIQHWQENEARRTLLLDEELSQQRVCERVAGESSSSPVVEVQPVLRDVVSTTHGAMRVIESTTEGAMIADVGTTEGAPTIVPAGSEKPDPLLVDDSPALCATGLLHPIHFLLLFLYALGTIAFIFVGGGVNGL